jgi:hypothetical protein
MALPSRSTVRKPITQFRMVAKGPCPMAPMPVRMGSAMGTFTTSCFYKNRRREFDHDVLNLGGDT